MIESSSLVGGSSNSLIIPIVEKFSTSSVDLFVNLEVLQGWVQQTWAFICLEPWQMKIAGLSCPKTVAGHFHSGELSRLKKTSSSISYMTLLDERIFFRSAVFNLLHDSDSIYGFLAACNAVRCINISCAGNLLLMKLGKLGFCRNTSWEGENTLWLIK